MLNPYIKTKEKTWHQGETAKGQENSNMKLEWKQLGLPSQWQSILNIGKANFQGGRGGGESIPWNKPCEHCCYIIKLGGLGVLPQENFNFFNFWDVFLVASETRLSVISTGSPPLIKYRMGNVYPPARSAKLKIIYGLKLHIWALSCMLRMRLVATLKEGWTASKEGRMPPPPSRPP
jgi:hypothetical protein